MLLTAAANGVREEGAMMPRFGRFTGFSDVVFVLFLLLLFVHFRATARPQAAASAVTFCQVFIMIITKGVAILGYSLPAIAVTFFFLQMGGIEGAEKMAVVRAVMVQTMKEESSLIIIIQIRTTQEEYLSFSVPMTPLLLISYLYILTYLWSHSQK